MLQIQAPGYFHKPGARLATRHRCCASLHQRPDANPAHSHKRAKTNLAPSIRSEGQILNSRHTPITSGCEQTSRLKPCQAGGGGQGSSGGSGGGSGGGGGDGNSGWSDGSVEALLAAAGKSLDQLPKDLVEAVKAGRIPTDVVQRYFSLENNSLLRPFLKFGGMRERLLGDPQFPAKVAIELGIGLTMKVTAEWNKRGKSFKKELDLVTANVIMALIADFMLVWLPAPRAVLAAPSASAKAPSKIAQFFKNCPDNAFQVVQPGHSPYSLLQRSGAVARNGTKLLAVGFGASMLGVGITNALTAVRSMLDSNFKAQNPPQNPITTSAAYASYLGTSANFRYQVVAGIIEERGIERIFHGNASLCSILSLAVRTGNTFLGSLMWVDYLRLIGLQKASEDH
ncbi:hypothetical protein WJX74_000859 [Apatococcus lobatus]|uniref:Uncharacterized protein n=2 Tax=Apatococcus TaxID=904362 RepID=A0AAW1STN7_9CHLO